MVRKIGRNGAEAVIFSGYYPEAVKILSRMRKMQMRTIFIASDGVKADAFISSAGNDAEGVYVSGPKDVSGNPMAKAAIDAHRKEHGKDPGAFYLNAYSAALVLIQAYQKAGTTDPESIKSVMRNGVFNTPIGTIRFNGARRCGGGRTRHVPGKKRSFHRDRMTLCPGTKIRPVSGSDRNLYAVLADGLFSPGGGQRALERRRIGANDHADRF